MVETDRAMARIEMEVRRRVTLGPPSGRTAGSRRRAECYGHVVRKAKPWGDQGGPGPSPPRRSMAGDDRQTRSRAAPVRPGAAAPGPRPDGPGVRPAAG